ncbi:SRPBCC family protein [Sciscionella marina]|uniref:SRPBCC family protein n=1 Tax=Sciscionella marina TaxID=508770 RepID=UPI00036A50EE|nr:SRPBCC family protein [Sciscionella marina]
MAQVFVSAQRQIAAEPDAVFAVLSDYAQARKNMLTENFSEYAVREGGKGEGTVVAWKLQATKKRVRDCVFEVRAGGERELVESDRNSSMVTKWAVRAPGEGSTVTVETTWNGAGGIGGFFEKTFAPLGMRKIYEAQLEKLSGILSSR